jgi:Organic solute transporter Ostalpha
LTFWQGLAISILVGIHYGATAGGSPTMTVVTTRPPIPSAPTFPVLSLAPAMAPVVAVDGSPTPLLNPIPLPITLAPASEDSPVDNNSTRFRRRLMNVDELRREAMDSNSSSFHAHSTKHEKEKDFKTTAHERASQIQNFLICLEMLFFSMAHYCVFPAEEWRPDYRPQAHYAKPGIGLKDFVKDIGYIMTSSSSARRRAAYHRQSNTGSSSNHSHTNESDLDLDEEINDGDNGDNRLAETVSVSYADDGGEGDCSRTDNLSHHTIT